MPRRHPRPRLYSLLLGLVLALPIQAATPEDEVIERWVKALQPSTQSEEAMRRELRWFVEVSRPFRGKKIKTVAEDIDTHYWERDVLAKAFAELTGIQVQHDVIGEGAVVETILEQMSTGKDLYDAYVNDADHIGTHLRLQAVVDLTEYMAGEGKPYTNPDLDLPDFLNLAFGQDYEGHQLQLPDQQFANLYWFRYDWFTRPDIKARFRAWTEQKYGKDGGYELGVPVNWAAYEDIAEFFTDHPIDGKKVYGHMDFGKKAPSLGWRFTDAWLSMAGAGDRGIPNGLPVDEWGIRAENRIPVGASVERGGDANGPAAVYALSTYIDWLKKYTPPEARAGTWIDVPVRPARGDVAQQIFFYILWLGRDEYHKPGSPVVGRDGKPLWRVAPTPHGRYWEPGMQEGYQDAGSWTIPKNTKGQKRTAAWLWAQFCVSKSVALKKFLIGGTPIRKSTIHSDYVQQRKADWGGLVEFYASPIEAHWTSSGRNVPHYPILFRVWWPPLDKAIDGQLTPQQAMDNIARDMDALMGKMRLAQYSPQLAEPKGRDYWLAAPGAPKPERPREKPQTQPYEELLKRWQGP